MTQHPSTHLNYTKENDTAALLWLGIALFIGISIAFILPLTPQDYWWYLRIGRDTLETGSIPSVDALTWSRSGVPVVYHSWGSAVIFWLVYSLGNIPLTFLLRGLVVALAYGLIWLTARRLGAARLSLGLVLLLGILVSSSNWSLRPQLLTYPLFTLALHLLYRWQGGKDKAVLWLPVISLLWVNLHGSFIMLFLLAGAALFFGKGNRRILSFSLAGALLATLANPRGIGAWVYVYQSLTAPSSQSFSVEWLPPVNSGWQMNLFFLWFLVFPVLAVKSTRRLNSLEWVWFLGFGFLALWGLRYGIWFIMILTVLTACLLADWEKKHVKDAGQSHPAVNLAAAGLLILLPLSLLPGLRETWWKGSPAVTENTPTAAVDWLAVHPELPGPLWSEIGFASYLEFALPERQPWIDTRFEVFPVEQWQVHKAINEAGYNWENLLEQTGANLLLVSVQEQPRLLEALGASPGWCERYRDEGAVIFQHGACGGE